MKKIFKKFMICFAILGILFSNCDMINAKTISMKPQNEVINAYEGEILYFKKPVKKSKVKWTSSNTAVVVITQSGKAKLKSAGKAWIKAKWGKSTVKVKVVVLQPYVRADKDELDVDENMECNLVGADVVEWRVNDSTVASITAQGILTGHKSGIVEVTARTKNNKIYSKKIEIYNSQRMQGLLNNKRLVSHRGYNVEAPENTMSAFEKAYEYGYKYVETDVTFTSDGVPVLLHDDTVDRTSNGTGKIRNLSFSYVRSLDFGSWKSSQYSGERIPTFEEFIQFCWTHDIHPYVELKSNITQERVYKLLDIVEKYHMSNKVSWVSFNVNYLEYIKNIDSSMELGINITKINENTFYWVDRLKTENNIVFLSAIGSCLNNEMIQQCKECNIPIGVWTYDSRDQIIQVDPYVNMIMTNCVKLDE